MVEGPPDSELVRELNLTKPQWLFTAEYWDQRIKLARNQRNALVALLITVCAYIIANSLAPEVAQQAAYMSILDLLYSWAVPLCLGLGTIILITMEVLIFILNKAVAKHLRIEPEKVKRIIELGNEIAMHTLLFKKTPKGNDA